MQPITIVLLSLVAFISSIMAVALAVFANRNRARARQSGATVYLIGWLLFIWPLPILAFVVNLRIDDKSTATVYVLCGFSMLFGALIITVRYFATSIIRWHMEVKQGQSTRRMLAANYLHWFGLLVVLASSGVIATQSGSSIWFGVLAALVGGLVMIGARILH